MFKKDIKFSKNDPLNELDTMEQTYGCRCYNPDICKGNGGDNCALCNETHICSTPPKSWKKIYLELLANKEE